MRHLQARFTPRRRVPACLRTAVIPAPHDACSLLIFKAPRSLMLMLDRALLPTCRHAYLRREPMARALLLRERTLGGAMLAASLWLAIKFEATRPTTPDANLMSRISGECTHTPAAAMSLAAARPLLAHAHAALTTCCSPPCWVPTASAGIPAGLLRQQERQILADLQWDLMTPAREVSQAHCAPPPPCHPAWDLLARSASPRAPRSCRLLPGPLSTPEALNSHSCLCAHARARMH